MKKSKHEYTLKLTRRQVKMLNYACDRLSRIICGQDWTYREFMEAAWNKRCKEAVGGHGMDKEWDGGWYKMREDAESLSKSIKKRFWGMESNAMYGIHYDETADILFDLHRVLRYQLWLDGKRDFHGVDSDEPTSPIGVEPLATISHDHENDKDDERD